MNFENMLDVFALWMSRGCAITARDANGLNAGETVVAGECKGIKKTGSDGMLISDQLNEMKRIFVSDLTSKQRQALAVELNMTDYIPPCKTQSEKADIIGISRKAYERRLSSAKKIMYFQLTKQHRVLTLRGTNVIFL